MKSSLAAGLSATRTFTVDKDRTIGFMGEELRVYATPRLVEDIEVTCREMILDHVDAGEDSVGTRVEVDHLAPTLLGDTVEITATVKEVEGRLVTYEVRAKDGSDKVAKCIHKRFVVGVDQLAERLNAKRAKM